MESSQAQSVKALIQGKESGGVASPRLKAAHAGGLSCSGQPPQRTTPSSSRWPPLKV